ncbi:cobalt-precorrin-5B (C1)-methyltransferase [Faunimonas pinastri]|uniref:Cobalt-precorrin-5B C(1)-methyltransferase n=1 Tax=Faunimonas pinastri TaxID=1855383 RepID=A0A1H9LZ01_9HYPH|nr:cobalt-precorrin-5B (C(1))-methyltransferase [Faunimonas pinastri]SER16658.1 cobalt-precorrin-5B (C1)-methyltransferase [Faunimonas pinastri]
MPPHSPDDGARRPNRGEDRPLRRGWTTGACATAAAKAAWNALLTGDFPDPVTIRLPRGETPAFALARTDRGADWASASVIKDAGDDPDVTHGAEVVATVRRGETGTGIRFRAGAGVGTVTRPGLPIPPGEPAINPVPRAMMIEALSEIGVAPDAEIEISIVGGAALAEKTWNPRLGIVGGLSVLGTSGIVVPFSCAAWIASIHRGIDVARAGGLAHVAGSTGNMSEQAVQNRYGLEVSALIDMGDFAGGMLKYLRTHPVPQVTISGGFAKLTKLAQGALDLHSARSQVDKSYLATLAREHGAPPGLIEALEGVNTAAEALSRADAAGVPLAAIVGLKARDTARSVLGDGPVRVNVLVVGRAGEVLAESGFDRDA